MPVGTLVLPDPIRVLIGTDYGADGTEFTGSLTIPGAWQVKDGWVYGIGGIGETGNLIVPPPGDVVSPFQYGGDPFGSGQQFTGTFTAPSVGTVVEGIQYGAGGVEFTGNFLVPPESTVLLGFDYGALGVQYTGTLFAPTPRPAPSTVTQANQGVDLLDVIAGLTRLLGYTLDLQQSSDGSFRDVVLWDHPSRVQTTGRERMVWFKLVQEGIQESAGPGRYGNKDIIQLNLGLVTRGFSDGSQRDIRRAAYHYLYTKRLIDALQNRNLFYLYQAQPINPSVWTPPAPVEGEVPLSVAPMTIASLPGPVKTQLEEGSNESTFTLSIPCVLLLTLPTEDNP